MNPTLCLNAESFIQVPSNSHCCLVAEWGASSISDETTPVTQKHYNAFISSFWIYPSPCPEDVFFRICLHWIFSSSSFLYICCTSFSTTQIPCLPTQQLLCSKCSHYSAVQHRPIVAFLIQDTVGLKKKSCIWWSEKEKVKNPNEISLTLP